ncbi:MAG TPA: NUDIX domain-containing protein [Novosphingobium sp.]|nr:NUDIX domain-containing protein [Novosphingobium sp.]
MSAPEAMPAIARRVRRAARILLIDQSERILAFRFTAPDRPPFWCLPGGECESGEDFVQAAIRELAEETGIAISDPGAVVAREGGDFVTLQGEPVRGDECFFLVRVAAAQIDTSSHTEVEQAVMREHRWFARDEIASWPETIYPERLGAILDTLA